MKTLLLLTGLTILNINISFCQLETSLVQTIPVNEARFTFIHLPGEVEVVAWDQENIQVEASLELKHANKNIMKHLVKLGRYQIQPDKDDLELILTMPKQKRTIIIKGENLEEYFTFKVKLPKDMIYKIHPDCNKNTMAYTVVK